MFQFNIASHDAIVHSSWRSNWDLPSKVTKWGATMIEFRLPPLLLVTFKSRFRCEIHWLLLQARSSRRAKDMRRPHNNCATDSSLDHGGFMKGNRRCKGRERERAGTSAAEMPADCCRKFEFYQFNNIMHSLIAYFVFRRQNRKCTRRKFTFNSLV